MYPEYSDENNAWEPLAEAYLKKGDKAAATDVLKRYLTYSELAFGSYVKLSELLEESGDKAGAAKSLEGAMYVRPMDLKGHSKLGSLMLELKQYRQCRARIRNHDCLENPGSGDSLLSAGAILPWRWKACGSPQSRAQLPGYRTVLRAGPEAFSRNLKVRGI